MLIVLSVLILQSFGFENHQLTTKCLAYRDPVFNTLTEISARMP